MGMPIDEQARKFHEREYDHLATALEARTAEKIEVMKYTFFAVVAVITWLTTPSHTFFPELKAVACMIPLGISLFGWIRNYGVTVQIRIIHLYMRELERDFGNFHLGYTRFNRTVLDRWSRRCCLIRLSDVNLIYGGLSSLCAFSAYLIFTANVRS